MGPFRSNFDPKNSKQNPPPRKKYIYIFKSILNCYATATSCTKSEEFSALTFTKSSFRASFGRLLSQKPYIETTQKIQFKSALIYMLQ